MLRGMGEGLKEQYRRRNYHQIDKINRSRHTCGTTQLHKMSFFKKSGSWEDRLLRKVKTIKVNTSSEEDKNKNDKRKCMVDERQSFVLDVFRFRQTRCIRVQNSGRRFLLKFGTLCRIMRRHIPVTLATVGNSDLSRQATVGITFV